MPPGPGEQSNKPKGHKPYVPCTDGTAMPVNIADNCLFSINLSIILILSGKPWIGKDPTLELSSPVQPNFS